VGAAGRHGITVRVDILDLLVDIIVDEINRALSVEFVGIRNLHPKRLIAMVEKGTGQERGGGSGEDAKPRLFISWAHE
jgi:hypothetical protein